jgi:hypothetical protein
MTSSAKARTAKHHKAHKLVQAWVSPKLRESLEALAKSEGRSLANFVRHALGKIAGIPDQPGRGPDVTVSIDDRCSQFANVIVPEFKGGNKSYSCTGDVAKRWQAAWDGACMALGHDPRDYRDAPRKLREVPT